MKDYIVTVMAQDRVGIVRDVSSALASLDGNITHVSQTVLRGYFTLILSVGVSEDHSQLEIKQAVERSGGVGELEVNVRPFVEIAASEKIPSERFTLSLKGEDRPGVICLITNHLAARKVNLDDFYAYARDDQFVMLVQVSIPKGVDVEKLQSELEKIGSEKGFAVNLQHENIFRATSEITSVVDLQREG